MESMGWAKGDGSKMSFWNGKRVFVTGATGLIGSWLVKELILHKAEVVVLVRDHDPQSLLFKTGDIDSVHLISGSLEDYRSVERAINEYEVDTIFHLGAQTIVERAYRAPLATFESNIRGTYQLLDACRRLSSLVKRIVIASSDKAYGSSPILPYTEGMALNGRHPYDVSKSCTDLIALSYAHTYKLPIAISRCGNIYGGGDFNWSRIIPGTIRSLLREEAPVIRSNGHFVRDYVFVKDIVQAYLKLAEALEREEIHGEAFNFSPGAPYTVFEIVQRIQKIMGCTHLTPRVLNEAAAEIQAQLLDSKKAETLLHWSPLYTLEEGLQETVVWYEQFLQHEKSLA